MSDTDVPPGDLPADHPLFHDPHWAIADALTCDAAFGRTPAHQPTPILDRLRTLGWDLTRTKDPSELTRIPPRVRRGPTGRPCLNIDHQQ